MLRLHALGWGFKRIAREFGCSRNTVRRYVAADGWMAYRRRAGADLLFGFISQRYERRSLVVTTNLPFARWSEVFLDPTATAAVIDRIVRHAAVLQTTGDGYRLAAAKRNRRPAAGKREAR